MLLSTKRHSSSSSGTQKSPITLSSNFRGVSIPRTSHANIPKIIYLISTDIGPSHYDLLLLGPVRLVILLGFRVFILYCCSTELFRRTDFLGSFLNSQGWSRIPLDFVIRNTQLEIQLNACFWGAQDIQETTQRSRQLFSDIARWTECLLHPFQLVLCSPFWKTLRK